LSDQVATTTNQHKPAATQGWCIFALIPPPIGMTILPPFRMPQSPGLRISTLPPIRISNLPLAGQYSVRGNGHYKFERVFRGVPKPKSSLIEKLPRFNI